MFTLLVNEVGIESSQFSTDLDMAMGENRPQVRNPVSNRSSLSDEEVVRYIDKSPGNSLRHRPRSFKSSSTKKGSMRGSFRVPKQEDTDTNELNIDKTVETNMVSLFYRLQAHNCSNVS